MNRNACYLNYLFWAACCLISFVSTAQKDSTRVPSNKLEEIRIHAFNTELPRILIAGAITKLDSTQFQSYSDQSILPAVNSTPGARMEERSPGSYRFGIRGSALEAPFGVRNLKVYYNDIPLTEPGGTTYINSLGRYNISELEIIRGPGGSIYGSGIGGVLLINSLESIWKPGVEFNLTGGSYGYGSLELGLNFGDSAHQNSVRYQHLQGNGYRRQ